MREDKFKIIKELFIDDFEKEGGKINTEFSYANCRVYANFPPNDAPKFGYFSMYMDCILDKADFDKSDNVSLGILAYDHDNKFTINAEICWGDPSGETEEKVFEEPVAVTEKSLAVMKGKLPNLVLKLREIIRDNPNGI